MTHEETLASYASPGVFAGLGEFGGQIDTLPGGVAAIASFVQNLLMHEGLASAYGVTLSSQRIEEKQLHGAAAMLDRATRLADRSLSAPRAPEHRVIGVCRHFATLFVACMRHRGVPARVRCGFANYFAQGRNLDHWVGEYWNADEGRWVLVDAQIDDKQRAYFRLTLNTLDVPRDRFLVAGDAWRACRGGADPMHFGVAGSTNWGLIEVYGNIFQDLAALQKVELLPWGWYGLALDESGVEDIALMDRLAAFSSVADAAALDELRAEVAADDRLRVPDDRVAATVRAERRPRQGRALASGSASAPPHA